MQTLPGKNIWIIGASEGIGRALAVALAQQGAHVAVSARNETRLNELVTELGSGQHLTAPCDVTQLTSVESAFQKVTSTWARIDMVIYNVGIYQPMTVLSYDLKKLENTIDFNLIGALRVLNFIVPYFLKANVGHIALVASVAGFRGLPNALGYGASKAALIHIAENLRCDLYDKNIKIQVINPGFVETRLTAQNNFKMPGIIPAEKAAHYIVKGLQSKKFEIHFPPLFSSALKLLRILPYSLYFRLIKNFKNE